MAAKLQAELSVKLGSTTAAMNALSARIKNGLAPLRRFQAASAGIGRSLAPLAGYVRSAAVGIAAAAAGAGGLGLGIKKALDDGGALSELSTQTGIAADKLMVLQQAFTNAGVPAENLRMVMNKMQRAIAQAGQGDKGPAEALARIGLSAEALANMAPDEQFHAIGAAINGLADPTQRAAAAMDIFGRSGGEMLTLFADGQDGLAKAAAQVGEQAGIMAKNANFFDRLSDDLGTAGLKLRGFFVGMADELAPALEPLITFFSTTDFAGAGQSFGRAIAVAVQSLTDGSIWKIMGISALISVRNVVNALWKGLVTVVTAIGQMLVSQFMVALEVFKTLTTADFWVGLGAQIVSWASRFNALIFAGFVKLADFLKPILAKVGLGGAVEKLKSTYQDLASQQTQQADAMQNTVNDRAAQIRDRLMERLAEEAGKIASAFTDTYGKTADILDNTDLQASMDGMIGEVMDKVQANYGKADRKTGGSRKGGTDTEGNDTPEPKDTDKGRRPEATRLITLGGVPSSMGVFLKNVLARDPLLAENRRQTKAIEGVKASVDALASKLPNAFPGGIKRFA